MRLKEEKDRPYRKRSPRGCPRGAAGCSTLRISATRRRWRELLVVGKIWRELLVSLSSGEEGQEGEGLLRR